MNICVFGAASDKVDKIYAIETEKLGYQMAKRGFGLVYGGGATGMMGAIARGVKSGGGYVHGVAPKYFDTPGILWKDSDKFTFTDTIRERKQIMEDDSAAFIMTPGGVGTFEEFFEILTLANLGRHKKPIAIYNIAGYFDTIVELVDKGVKEGFISSDIYGNFNIFTDPEELLDYIANNAK